MIDMHPASSVRSSMSNHSAELLAPVDSTSAVAVELLAARHMSHRFADFRSDPGCQVEAVCLGKKTASQRWDIIQLSRSTWLSCLLLISRQYSSHPEERETTPNACNFVPSLVRASPFYPSSRRDLAVKLLLNTDHTMHITFSLRTRGPELESHITGTHTLLQCLH